jgi:hypothetical protein
MVEDVIRIMQGYTCNKVLIYIQIQSVILRDNCNTVRLAQARMNDCCGALIVAMNSYATWMLGMFAQWRERLDNFIPSSNVAMVSAS